MPDEKYYNCSNNHLPLEQVLKDLIYKDSQGQPYLRLKIDGISEQITTVSVASAPSSSYVQGGGQTITDSDMFGGYTIAQITEALITNGILE